MPQGVINKETIAAIATAPGRGAIGIVRISGSLSENILQKIFSAFPKCKTNLLVHGNIIDPEKKSIIDDVLLCMHRAPYSYTGEDVGEIFAHGGDINLGLILELVCRCGARVAQPGEFTRRAFLNGKIDLTRAEAVEELISAKDRKTHDLALKQIGGSFAGILEKWKDEIIAIAAGFEVMLEYPEENHPADLFVDIKKQLKYVQYLYSVLEDKKNSKNGINVIITGRTNTGKSSLFNRLMKHDRVIVSDEHGTTRDVVAESIKIKDLSIMLHDTAGMKEAETEVEKKALQFTSQYLEKADLIIFVMDVSSKITPADENIFEILKKLEKSYILCLNKTDLLKQLDETAIQQNNNEIARIALSTLTGEGLDRLCEYVYSRFSGQNNGDFPFIYSPRYEYLLKKMETILIEIGDLQSVGESLDKTSVRIKDLIDCFNGFSGVKTDENILDSIFSKFCVGK